jgi:prolyl-tRNA editing enzyme YbaK/EbsC (Cys-tRNA(Pro) deacylase)
MITPISPITPMRIPFIHRLITSSHSLLSRRAFLPRATAAAADDVVVLDSTHIDEFIKTRGIVTIPQKHEAAEAAAEAAATETLKAASLDACPLKCLLFLASGSPILIVLRSEDRVSEQALATFLNVAKSRVEMARTSQLIPITGFPVGQVPPFGHRAPLYTLVDQCVTSHSHVVFGDNLEYVLPTTELLRASNGKVAAVSVTAVSSAVEGSGSGNSTTGDAKERRLPVPWVAGAQAVSLTGVIAQKRKIANLLLFLNIVPPSPGQLGKVRKPTEIL